MRRCRSARCRIFLPACETWRDTCTALEFLILTATRTGEVIGTRWDEIDFSEKVWTVPASRMKAGREHRVPLAARALRILNDMVAVRTSDFVFPGFRRDRSLSNMAMRMTARRAGITQTVHGFRSAFRDWAGERTNFPRGDCRSRARACRGRRYRARLSARRCT